MATAINRTTYELHTGVQAASYDTNDWLVDPDLSAVSGVDPRLYVVDGETVRAANATEEQAVVNAWIPFRTEALIDDAFEFIFEHYPRYAQDTLFLLYRLANKTGLTNRANYISQMDMWAADVLSEYMYRSSLLPSQTTLAALEAVELDLEEFDDSDPLVSTTGALQITD